jgi:hypothetical protein
MKTTVNTPQAPLLSVTPQQYTTTQVQPVNPLLVQQSTQQPSQGGGLTPLTVASDATKIYRYGSSVSSPTPASGAGGAITTGINEFGASYLGTGTGAVGSGALTATPLTTLGAAGGIGYAVGGPIAHAVGGNEEGGSIGGAVGGIAGSALAGTATGLAFGAALGIGAQALNFVIPGLGIVAGALIGAMVGGGKTPHPDSEYGATIGDGMQLMNVDARSKHMSTDPAKQLSGQVNDYLGILKQFGVDASGQVVRGGYSMGNGFLGMTKSGTKGVSSYGSADEILFNFSPDKPTDEAKALTDFGTYLAQKSGADENTIARIKQYQSRLEQSLNPRGEAAQQSAALGLNGGQARNAAGIPTVAARGAIGGNAAVSTFDDFVKNYKQQQQTNAV